MGAVECAALWELCLWNRDASVEGVFVEERIPSSYFGWVKINGKGWVLGERCRDG